MKIKDIFKFILIFITIILIYIGFIINIDYFIVSYNEKAEEYTNPYHRGEGETNILNELKLLKDYDEDVINKGVELAKNDKIINNILKETNDLKENGIEKYLNTLIKKDLISSVKDSNIYGDIAVIDNKLCEIAFSIDGNNIILEKEQEYIENEFWSTKEITSENKELIYAKVKQKLEEIGIVQKFGFEPDTIYIKYYDEKQSEIEGELYIIEDNKNHIKIEYEVPRYEIRRLQIGFEYSLVK